MTKDTSNYYMFWSKYTLMPPFHEVYNRIKCTIQCFDMPCSFASLNGTFHLLPHENIVPLHE